MAQKYSEQYNRMKRWYSRIKNPDDGIYNELDGSLCRDDICYAFFMCCYHLKDWIKNDESLKKEKKANVKEFIEQSFYLKTCRSICNASKHLKKDRSEKSPVKIKRKGFMHNLFGSGPTYATVEYRVQVDDKDFDVIEFAKKCIEEWDKFFEDNALPIPKKDETIHFDS